MILTSGYEMNFYENHEANNNDTSYFYSFYTEIVISEDISFQATDMFHLQQ